MIASIGNSASFRPPPPPQASGNNALSSDQSELIEETLSSYDANNLTKQDAQDIVSAFSEAGINPSKEFADLLAESGFDAKEIGSMAGVEKGAGGQRPPPPPQPSDGGSESIALSKVVDYLDSLSDSSFSDSTTMAASLAERFGLSEGQSLINTTA